jgi:hypothetical protein
MGIALPIQDKSGFNLLHFPRYAIQIGSLKNKFHKLKDSEKAV